MAHFYSVTDTKGRSAAKTACGNKASGLTTYAASWNGAVACHLYHSEGRDFVRVELMPWSSSGTATPGPRRLLYDGPVDMGAIKETDALAAALTDAASRLAHGGEHG